MPIHDWTRVDAGIFHDFHHEWISSIKRALNAGLLPPDCYALAEQIAGGLLPDVPLFLEPDRYILTPLEATYADAFTAVPKRWRDELEP